MNRAKGRTLRIGAVGGGRVGDALPDRTDDPPTGLVVEALPPTADPGTFDTDRFDCVLVDGTADGVDAAETAVRYERETPLPAVALVDDWASDRVADALSTGVDAALPRELLETDPEAVADRVASAADADAPDPVADRERRSVLFENNPDPVIRIRFENDEPIVRSVNPAFESVFGFSPEEIIGESLVDVLVPPADRPDHDRIRSRVQRGEPLEMEATRLTATGPREFLFRVIHFAAPDAESDTEAYVWYTDVTERKRRERLVRRVYDSTERIQNADSERAVCAATAEAARSVLDLDAPACWIASEEGRLTPVAGATSRWSVGDGPADGGPEAALDSGEVTTVGPEETGPDGADGGVFVPLGDHGVLGATAGADGVDDVTLDAVRILTRHAATALDRVENRREIRESERRFRLIAERIEEVIFLSEPDFSEVFYVNDAYEEIWGEPVERLYEEPRSFVDRIDERDRETFESEFAAMLDDIEAGEADDRYVFEYRVRPDPDEVRWVRATGYPVEVGDETRFVGVVEDITERRELEATYRGIFENVSDGLVVHHPETGEIRDVNEQFCEMNGYDRQQLIGETVDVVTGPDHGYEQARDRIRAAREEGPQLFEWRNRTADGETFPVEVHLSVVEIRGEERVLGSVRDITERRSTERRLSEVLDRIDDAVYITPAANLATAESGPDYLSGGYEEIWGQSLDDIRRRYDDGFFDTLHPDDRAAYREFVERVADEVTAGADADSYDIEYRIERPDGEVRWVRSEYYPFEWGQGPVRIVVVTRDITERKRVRRNLRTIAERVDEAIYLSSPDKREVYYASPSFEDLWDLPIERVYDDPQAFIDRVHPDDREWFREEYDRIRADLTDPDREPQDTYELEYRVRHRDGEVRWIDVRGYPVTDESGSVDRWIAVNRDVTDRKARERRIASFDEATEDLTTADSTAEAAETAVAAARETLELPAVGAFLYDDGAGVLRPEVLAGALSETEANPVGPNDGPLWEAFASRTVVGPDDAERDVGGDDRPAAPGGVDDLAAWRAIPLGTHGVLVVGSPDGTLGSDVVQTAHVLAATLEAALAHLQGQKRVADREQQLRTQTERAERLDRIARLTRRVEAAITEATSPGEIERAVCDRLATSGPYDLAWVGGVEVGADRLSCRAVSGEPEEHIDAMRLRTGEERADPHPAVKAWRTDSVRTANSLVGGGPASEWRQRALSAGYQSLCAVPLTYDGVTHGVLTIGTDAPNSFEDRERETLAQLGTSIANALAAIERRRALESDETVELEFHGPGEDLPFARAAERAGCRVRLQRTVARQTGPSSVYYSFEGAVPDDVPEVARRTLPGSVDVVDDGGTTLVEVRADEWFGAPIAEYGGMVREASAEPDGTTIRVEVPGETDVRSFADRLREVAPSLELAAKRQRTQGSKSPTELAGTLREELTDRQLEVIETALSAGYFEWPREHDSSEVASRLGITQPTFNKHLRVAERETFEFLFGPDG
ncbi:PAS domain S-box protein [Halobellus ruber]|uniref:histidine kinase n=1 Tax=Halobellus ruber TaxID=2761102 RepID=A0A7J9SGT4_9EURY|nr:PAS domain S-box protein [Halobellus ruber]MBB6646175.1 PAS domain S-box protein [Halobellus ruber]